MFAYCKTNSFYSYFYTLKKSNRYEKTIPTLIVALPRSMQHRT